MFVTKDYNGSITVSDIVGGLRVKQTYYGYSESQAKKNFKELLKNRSK